MILNRFQASWLVATLLLAYLTFLGPLYAADGPAISTQTPTIEESVVVGDEPAKPVVKAEAKKPDPKVLKNGPPASWIWAADGRSSCLFNKRFEGGSKSARLIATCDNQMVLFLNGKRVAESGNWENPITTDVQKYLNPGVNQILVRAQNQGGPSGFALKLALTMPDGSVRHTVTDKSWKVAENDEASKWSAVKVLGKMGVQPWGDVFGAPRSAVSSTKRRNVFEVQPGFQVELLYTVPKGTQGSWVSITFDPKGRLIASDQGKSGLFRITPPPVGSDEPTRVEPLNTKITSAQGMLYAFDSLYLSVNGGPGSGFYRARDTNGDDQFDEVVKLKALQGGGEHGPHAVRLGPDGKSLFVIAGNHTNPPADFDHSRVPKNWSEDLLLPRQWDARGHARGRLAPGGWIAETDADGKSWEIISTGYRNPYDMAFNAEGELFAYDADMEWDMGAPWYRPTRVCHAVSGSEFGWRSGTGKWPTWYVDSLPPVVDIGPGSPVGVEFGYGTRFPARYQRAMYILDWTFGTMYAVHLTPEGSSYRGEIEEFVARSPLPLTDAAVGPDGALYFTIGGRGTQSALYRVTYVGDEPTQPVDGRDDQFAELRKLRRSLESLHTAASSDAIDAIWPQLSHKDRHIRYAARVALEHQDIASWQDRALAETNSQALITAAVALARQGKPELQAGLLAALGKIDFAKLDETQQLELLRAYALVFIRMGSPDDATASRLARSLDPFYPSESNALNRELSRLLVYLNWPMVIEKTLVLMDREHPMSATPTAQLLARNSRYGGTIAKMLANQPEIEKIHHAFVLRNMRYGWTLEQRKKYFAWLDAASQKSGGASYKGFIGNIRKEALANASEAERKALAATTPPPKPTQLPKPQGPGRKWTLDEITALAGNGLSARNFENGKRAFAAARCIVCHRFDGEGGATGPDLTAVAGRFSVRDLTESLIDPSKVVSDQYRASLIETAKGKIISGRIVGENDEKLTVMTDPEDAAKIQEILRSQIAAIEPAKVSLMPNELLDVLNEDELLDLLAYLMSRGNPEDPQFAN